MTRSRYRAVSRALLCLSIALFALARPTPARAQAAGPQTNAPPPKGDDKKVEWKATAQAGLLWMAGNTNSLAVSASASASRNDKKNLLSLAVRGAYSTAGADFHHLTDLPTAANWMAELRYDRFFTEKNTVFVAARVSQDKFAGIWLRPEGQVGYARYFYESKRQVFRGELGAIYQYELDTVADPKDMAGNLTIPPTELDHTTPARNFIGGRAFLFYENKFTPYASFSEAAEAIPSYSPQAPIDPTDPTNTHSFRLLFNSVTSLSSTISTRVSLKVNFTVKVNTDPPIKTAGVLAMPMAMPPVAGALPVYYQQWDTITELVLAVTLL